MLSVLVVLTVLCLCSFGLCFGLLCVSLFSWNLFLSMLFLFCHLEQSAFCCCISFLDLVSVFVFLFGHLVSVFADFMSLLGSCRLFYVSSPFGLLCVVLCF